MDISYIRDQANLSRYCFKSDMPLYKWGVPLILSTVPLSLNVLTRLMI